MSTAGNLQRESACPVHFIWDGAGRGRWWVRMGFLGATAWGTLFFGAHVFRVTSVLPYVGWLGVPVAASWLLGQALTAVDKRRRR